MQIAISIAPSPSSFLVPGKRRQGPPEQGLENASKTNPPKTSIFVRAVVSSSRLARIIGEGSMNPVILLVDFPSADREELKSFLQEQRCEVVASHYADSAVGYCRQLQPD